jgi:uncharacterized protein (DUF58 family)
VAALPIGLYVALSMFGAPPHLRVSVNRILPEGQIYEGDDVRVALDVVNKGPPVNLEVAEQLPPSVEIGSGTNHAFMTLGEGETRRVVYTFIPRLFGTYVLGPIRVRSTDRSWARYEETTLGRRAFLRVYPKVKYLNRVELRQSHPRNWPGETITRRAGQGLEFYGIRERTPGESIRRTNWKATARAGTLMVNQYMDEAGGETLIILDLRSLTEVGIPPETTTTYSVRAAAALSYRLLRDRNRVGLLAVGPSLVKVPLGSGKRHFEKLMIGLISIGTGGMAEWTLDLVPYYVTYFFSRMVQILLISPLMDYAPVSLVAELARRGYDVLVVSPSPLELDVARAGVSRSNTLAKELAMIERRQKLSYMRSRAQVIDWNPSLPLGDVLERSKGNWRTRRFA